MSAADTLSPATTEDRLLGGRVRLRQPAAGYRVAVDSVLLAAAVPARGGESVLELGSGSGAAALCLHQRVPDCRITGLELDPGLLALARANADLNDAGAQVSFLAGDVAAPPPQIAAHAFDHVCANPPFLERGRADLRGGPPRHVAAHIEQGASLAIWIDKMANAVKPKGRLTLIQRADRLDDVLAALRRHAGEIVVFPLWPKAGRPAKRVLVSARTAVSTPLRLSAGLVLHEESGAYSAAARAVLENAAPLVI